MAKKVIFKMAAAAILNFKKINFWLRGYSICYSVQNFIKIGLFFTEIWRFNDFKMAAVRHLEFYTFAFFVP